MNRSAKIFLRIAAIAVSCMMLMSLFGAVQTKVLADETTYTVRILPGSKGTAETQVYEGMHYGDKITVYVNPALVNDDRYYAKGLKDSGMDNNEFYSEFVYDPSNPYLEDNGGGYWTITVTKDQDFVIAYGLASSIVSYTVNYVDAAGTAIAPSQTFYGSVGDMPVISYQYIDGYEPQSNNLTYLAAEGNEFTFTYSVVEQPTQPAEPETTTAAAEPTPAPGPEGEGGEGEGGTPTPAPGPEGEGGEGDIIDFGPDENPEVPLIGPEERSYDGFKLSDGSSESGLGDGTEDIEGLIDIDENEVAKTVERPDKSRYKVYGPDNTVLFEYEYTSKTFTGKTAFLGTLAAFLTQE